MKRATKIGTSLLSFTLVSSVIFAACSSDKPSASSASPTPGLSAAASAKPKTDITVRMMRGENAAQVIKTDTPVLKEIYKQTGVKINLEPVPGSNYIDKKRALLATNNIPDIFGLESKEVAEFAKTGVFLPISDYLDKMPNFSKIIQENPEIKRLYVDGKLYAFPITEKFKIQGGKALLIRTDILKELKLDVPKTFDDLYNVLKKMKEAYPDSYPWTTRGMSFMDAVALGMGTGYGMTYDSDKKQYFYGNNKPEFKEMLTYMNKLFKEKLLDPDFAINTKQNWDEKLSSGKSFFYYDNNQFAVNYNQALQEKNPNAKFDRIPYLINSTGKSKGYLYAKGWLVDNYAISSKTKDPEALLAMFDWMYGPEGTTVTNYGVLGETYEMANGQPKIMDSVIAKYKTAADPIRAMLSDIGGGLLALAVNVDEGPMKQTTHPDLVRWSEELVADPGAYIVPGVNPGFTVEENEKLKQITTKVTPLEADVVKFIMGAKPLTEFDKWAESLNAAGVPEMEKIYNDALARVK
ncbi:extracellular solute-binding protein [Paenibacillus cymbidii]|uniref:extracellular solute-binding protein n=1 Tax=Paenibacillus cymbidii TaxID=1639034 RepID=UPI0010801A5B|nr:extracellular solute-binding protein [Paenibacillus cymbidii]